MCQVLSALMAAVLAAVAAERHETSTVCQTDMGPASWFSRASVVRGRIPLLPALLGFRAGLSSKIIPYISGVPATVPSQSQSAPYESPAALTASSPAFTLGFAAIAACRRWLLMAVRGHLRGRLLAVVQVLLVAGL